MIRIIGGPFEGYEGRLLTTRGSKVKRLLVELPNFFSVGVEVNPDLIEIIYLCTIYTIILVAYNQRCKNI